MLTSKLLASVIEPDEIIPEGVDFDGTYDYLSRSSDLVGNTDSKTFTFSCWVYLTKYSTTDYNKVLFIDNTFEISFGSASILIQGKNSSNTVILQATHSSAIPLNTFCHILYSVDLSNTSNNKLYINDVLKAITNNTYTNSAIDFTKTSFRVFEEGVNGSPYSKGRLSHLFLSYDYIDLSVTENRRIFITEDGKPSETLLSNLTARGFGQPIIYLPLTDAATAHINKGTGGNFIQNGTLATSDRGANQWNCKASYFDGSADYLSRTSLTGAVDGKQFTFSVMIKPDSISSRSIFEIKNSGNPRLLVGINASGFAYVVAYNTSNTLILSFLSTDALIVKKNILFSCSIDLANPSNRYVTINGVTQSGTWSTYANDSIGFDSNQIALGRNAATSGTYFQGDIGELWFNTNLTDLSTSNPFWDDVENRPVPVAKVIADTGILPLIASPCSADNPTLNLGTGGAWTANSAPYVGARGGSEFWARSIKGNGSTGSLIKTGLSSIDSSYCSIVLAFKLTGTVDTVLASVFRPLWGGGYGLTLTISGQKLLVRGVNNVGSVILQATATTTTLLPDTWYIVEICIDMSSTSTRYIRINGVNQAVTWTTFTTGSSFGWSVLSSCSVLSLDTIFSNASVAWFYFNPTDYIDFSQEVNRNKFVDQLGYPRDLTPEIEAGNIPQPLFYLKFEDPSNLGLDSSGNNNHFTVNGTVTAGSDVFR